MKTVFKAPRFFFISFFSLFFLCVGVGAQIQNSTHLNLFTYDNVSNVTEEDSWLFTFNWTSADDCSGVLNSTNRTLSSNNLGVISVYLDDPQLSFDDQYYMCIERNGSLWQKPEVGVVPYAFSADHPSNPSWGPVDEIIFPNVDVAIRNGTNTWLWLVDPASAHGTAANRNLALYNLLARNTVELSGQAKLIFGYTDVDKYCYYNSTTDRVTCHVDEGSGHQFDKDVVFATNESTSYLWWMPDSGITEPKLLYSGPLDHQSNIVFNGTLQTGLGLGGSGTLVEANLKLNQSNGTPSGAQVFDFTFQDERTIDTGGTDFIRIIQLRPQRLNTFYSTVPMTATGTFMMGLRFLPTDQGYYISPNGNQNPVLEFARVDFSQINPNTHQNNTKSEYTLGGMRITGSPTCQGCNMTNTKAFGLDFDVALGNAHIPASGFNIGFVNYTAYGLYYHPTITQTCFGTPCTTYEWVARGDRGGFQARASLTSINDSAGGYYAVGPGSGTTAPGHGIFYYDGTDTVIDSKQVNSGGVLINSLPHGEIYVEGNSVATSMATQNVWYQFTGFDTNGESHRTTPDHTNDHITIAVDGTYMLTGSISFSGGNSKTYEIHVETNNGATSFDNCHLERKLGASGDIGSASISCLASFTAGDTVELWGRCTDITTSNPTFKDVTMSIVRIGG